METTFDIDDDETSLRLGAPLSRTDAIRIYSPCVFNPNGMPGALCRETSSAPLRAAKCGDCKSPFRTPGITPCQDDGLPSVARAFAQLAPPAFEMPVSNRIMRKLSAISREDALALSREIAHRITQKKQRGGDGYFAIACDFDLASEHVARKLHELQGLHPSVLALLDPGQTPETPLTVQIAALLTEFPRERQQEYAQRFHEGTLDELHLRQALAAFRTVQLPMHKPPKVSTAKRYTGQCRMVAAGARKLLARAMGLAEEGFIRKGIRPDKNALASIDDAIRILGEELATIHAVASGDPPRKAPTPFHQRRADAARAWEVFRDTCRAIHDRACVAQEKGTALRRRFVLPKEERHTLARLLEAALSDLRQARSILAPPAH